jgi:hypothetical protein
MKRTIEGITRIRDPLYAKVEKRHIEWLRGVETSIFFEGPLEDVGVTSKRVMILLEMGLIREAEESEWKKGIIYVLTEKGKKYV